VKLQQQELASSPELFQLLPQQLRDLAILSVRLQARILHLDQLIYARTELPTFSRPQEISPVQAQLDQLREAFMA
jgi:regulator of CtrA degradation